MKPLTSLKEILSTMLEITNGAPEDMEKFTEWRKTAKDTDVYPGWRIYKFRNINTWFIIKAKRHPNGGWVIRKFDVKPNSYRIEPTGDPTMFEAPNVC